MTNPLNGNEVRDAILNHEKSATEETAYFWFNLIKSVIEISKVALTVDNKCRVGVETFKVTKDFAQGDMVCSSLYCVSVGCEAMSFILVWCQIPGKVLTISVLKATSR